MLLGYSDHLSAREGDVARFMVSADRGPYRAQLVRLGGVDASGTVNEERIPSDIDGEHPGRTQPLVTGSYGIVEFEEVERLTSFTLQLWMCPTAVERGRQTVVRAVSTGVDAGGFELALDETGALALTLTGGAEPVAAVVSPVTIRSGAWLSVVAGYDAETSRIHLDVSIAAKWNPDREHARVERPVDATWRASIGQVLIGPGFNGRIEAPRIVRAGGDLACAWDFSVGVESRVITDISENRRHGRLVNRPARAVLGHDWSGGHLRFSDRPSEWGAIHFHEDDLEDAGWEADFELTIPGHLPSGIYAARLEQGKATEHIPFYVRPRRARADILFLAPTNVYLAYANERLAHGERGEALGLSKSEPIELDEADRYLLDHPELGSSLYDRHLDGSGVIHSSRLRPVLNMRPNYITWLNGGRRHFAADFYLTGWLEQNGFAFDVATDEDLHYEGVDLLRQYKVVITGTHPEYPSAREYDALEDYLSHGGRLMYLGANGFYWVTSFDGEHGHVIECRRGFAGFRNWTSHPAEVHHSSTGEMGGLWTHRGRPSHQLVGVGMCAAGFGPASGYRRTPESYTTEVAFVFEGIEDDETIGDFGLVLGGAAGDELDRTDAFLGTPRNARVLASSRHNDYYWPAIETQMEIAPGLSGATNPDVRAEVVLLDTSEGGRVFSTGSICWGASLAFNDYDNNVARMTENVLREFLRPAERGSLTPAGGEQPHRVVGGE